ncbi:MAG: hypothetical protein OEW25_01490 [Nitrospira sp.]|nr:hypothetical protein [Nitrospira sp.]MDH4327977.1 hypothetical protein [Nitrospira sp.]MDH5251971.1 hypothetical protein [Nitrospira sp.]
MKAMRGIIKWTVRSEGRIGRVWRRGGIVAAEPEAGKEYAGAGIPQGPNQARDRRKIRRSGCDWCEAVDP